MSDSETKGIDRTGLMESPASEAKRCADGMAVVAQLRARVLGYRAEAVIVAANHESNEWHYSASNFRGMAKAFDMILQELADLSGCDPASSDKAGSRNS